VDAIRVCSGESIYNLRHHDSVDLLVSFPPGVWLPLVNIVIEVTIPGVVFTDRAESSCGGIFSRSDAS